MDKNAIKKYAVWARNELIARVTQKAEQYEITEMKTTPKDADSINGRLLTDAEKNQRKALIEKIQADGFEQVMEEVAYTWFNRFTALRFMEVNNYLPSHTRVFTNEAGDFKPQILADAIQLDLEGLDMDKVFELKDANKTEELYKYLLITQCNALSAVLPRMFQKIEHYTELLLPDYLLREGSVIEQMITLIPEEDWTDQVQIIGWLYQYYNSEPKDAVFAALKKNVKISKENIPAATQLFTPDWIVRYMVENSLGRLWLEGHPNDSLKSEWKYYLDEVEQEADVKKQLESIRKEYANLKPEDIRCIDPCMGSGHILCYMFDVLVKIYEDYGYTAREAAENIVAKNLWGLDIDERAAQLSYFAVMMKARQYDRRFFNKKDESGLLRIPQPHVYAISESNGVDGYALEYFCGNDANIKKAMSVIMEETHDAKEYGSILPISDQNWDALNARISAVENDISMYRESVYPIISLINVAQTMSQKYDVVITNPPYMGLRNMSPKLFEYVMKNHKDTKQDLFGVFMRVCMDNYCNDQGKVAMITQHVWMFTSGFESFRRELYGTKTIVSLTHLGTRAFEEIAGEVVQTCAFIVDKQFVDGFKGNYVRLVNYPNAYEKEKQFFIKSNTYNNTSKNFLSIPGNPVCYWLSQKVVSVFENNPLVGDVSNTRQGLKTSDDKRFVRLFFEVDDSKVAKDIRSLEEASDSGKKWFWLNKGGQMKWYGNNVFLINWEDDGREVKDYATQVAGSYSKNITAIDAYFKHCISWPQISLSHPSFRYMPDGYIFASAGPSLFINDERQKWYMLGLLNSCVTQSILDAINPTINFGVSDILKVPYIYDETRRDEVDELVKRAIEIATESWNSYEISWDFKKHPLIRNTKRIEDAYLQWEKVCNDRFNELRKIEYRLNKIFCEIYGLDEELDSAVDEDSINVTRANKELDVKGLISYAVGCMFGRYSLDEDGVIFAGGKWDNQKYRTYVPDKDNIIPICDDEYFDDDIVGRFIGFIKTVYGTDTLEENLLFIANALGGKGSAREVIRSYFINNFFADHCSLYSVTGSGKRPIYWLFDSGKKNGFKCLIYMHRYQADTIARIRTDYVHEQQSRYRTAIADLEQRITSAGTSERVKINKQLQALQSQSDEIRKYEEKIHHLADQMIVIDLDDGIKKNYEVFKDVLAKI